VSYTPPSFGGAVGPSGYYSRAASVDPDISFTYSITQLRAERSSRHTGPERHYYQLQSYHVPSPKPRSRSLFDDRYRPFTNYYSKPTPSMPATKATKATTTPGNRYSSDHSQRAENSNLDANSGSILRHQKLATRPGVYDNITGRSRMAAGGARKLVSMTKWLDEEDKIPPPQPDDASTRKPFVADRPSKISAQALSDNKQLVQDKNITSCYINKGRMTKDKDCTMTTADSGFSSKEDFRNRKAAKFDEVAKSPGGGREMSSRAAPTVADACLDIESNSRRGIKAEKKPQSDTRRSTMSTTNYLKLFKFKSLSLGRCKKNKSCDSVEETSSTLAPPRATAAAVVLPKAEPDGKNKQARNTVAGGGKTAATTNMVKKATHVDTSYNQSLSSSKIPVYFSYTHKIPFDIAGNVNASPSRMSKGHIPSHQAPASGQGSFLCRNIITKNRLFISCGTS